MTCTASDYEVETLCKYGIVKKAGDRYYEPVAKKTWFACKRCGSWLDLPLDVIDPECEGGGYILYDRVCRVNHLLLPGDFPTIEQALKEGRFIASNKKPGKKWEASP